MDRDYDNGGLQNSNARYSVPGHWVEDTNRHLSILQGKIARLEAQLEALMAHEGIEFRDIPAQPAKVTVAKVVAAY